jgi:nicotinamide-nucleotide amidase
MSALIEIITIGREILDGRVVDTNSVWLAQKLKSKGLTVRHAQKVDDDHSRIQEAFKIASSRSNIILVTGGLGPTSDDLTAEAFARFKNVPWELNKQAEELVKNHLLSIKR